MPQLYTDCMVRESLLLEPTIIQAASISSAASWLSARLLLHKTQLIMVGHNEKSQAVEGIDQAEVLEIIDHHRIGTMETDGPVYFRNVPVGCTCTMARAVGR